MGHQGNDETAGIHTRVDKVIAMVAGVAAMYQLVVASRLLTWFGIFIPAGQHRAISLLFALSLIYALRSPRSATRTGKLPWFDALILGGGLVGAGFVAFNYGTVLEYSGYGYLDLKGIVFAVLLMAALWEAVRRLTGWALPIIIVFFLLVTSYQNFLPGLLHGKGFALDRLAYSTYVGTSGIFGTPLGVAVTILITYIVFGRLMQEAGAGQWFINLAMAVAGWTRGGVAKASIVASALFGMISGSPSAEVATIGSITIPMMVSTGYSPRFAAAVEAVAGTGGQFMPPVMGAIAFIMAEWFGVPYAQIATAALIPAALYFAVLFMSIHFEAQRLNLKAIPRRELSSVVACFKEGWFYVLPIGVLIYLLLGRHYPPEMAGIYSILALIAVSYLHPDKKRHLTLARIWASLVGSAKTWVTVAGVTAAVGILIGSLELSGLGIKFSGFIVDLTEGNLLATLLLVGLASFILGMGLDSIPAYMTLAVLAAPALIELGVPAMVAHLYVIYWGLASFITPPVCLAVYVACGISGSKIWETGWEAVRLGMAVFLVPLAFVYNQALLAQGGTWEIVAATVTAFLGSVFVAAALRGYLADKLPWWGRALSFAGGAVLIGPTTPYAVAVGMVLGLLGALGAYALSRNKQSSIEDRASVGDFK